MIVNVIDGPVVVNSNNGKRESDASKIGFVKICSSYCYESVLKISSAKIMQVHKKESIHNCA